MMYCDNVFRCLFLLLTPMTSIGFLLSVHNLYFLCILYFLVSCCHFGEIKFIYKSRHQKLFVVD